jgi:hypothetical protein
LREPLGDFLEEAKYLVDFARIHSPKSIALHKSMGRELSDLDFITYANNERKIFSLLGDAGYPIDRRSQMLMSVNKRYILRDRVNNRNLDVFFDRLDFCHVIDFKRRLEVDYPTISLADLLLEKLQIVKIEPKDLKDAIVLLREHNIGDADKETINAGYISKLLSGDWGFWYTFTTNLSKMQAHLQTLSMLPPDEHEKIGANIGNLRDRIEKEPKSMGWRMRARVGPKKQWYKTVDESPEMG